MMRAYASNTGTRRNLETLRRYGWRVLLTPDNPTWSTVGLFLGGSTEWKLRTMYEWGMVACSARRYYHVGRVNTARRIRLAAEAGADSFDGTSATMFSCTVPLLQAAKAQPSLLVPSMSLHMGRL